jgi:hypothetical protein
LRSLKLAYVNFKDCPRWQRIEGGLANAPGPPLRSIKTCPGWDLSGSPGIDRRGPNVGLQMPASLITELYISPNGDRWDLGKDSTGNLIVSHHPSKPSGGRPSEVALDVFLAHGRGVPEYQAVIDAFATLKLSDNTRTAGNTDQSLDQALGKAVARCWNGLPSEIQHDLFEAAVLAEGEAIRQPLALYLHAKHPRTIETVQARAMSEPDSLGG